MTTTLTFPVYTNTVYQQMADKMNIGYTVTATKELLFTWPFAGILPAEPSNEEDQFFNTVKKLVECPFTIEELTPTRYIFI